MREIDHFVQFSVKAYVAFFSLCVRDPELTF
jgi:hypothetical protein